MYSINIRYSPSLIVTDTTGLQSFEVVADPSSSSADITCVFAAGASALGCHVSFGDSLDVNISLAPGSTTAMTNVTLLGLASPVVVTVAEILMDGNVSLITLQSTVTFTNSKELSIGYVHHFPW